MGVFVGDAAEFAVAVHPGVGAFAGPAAGVFDGFGEAFPGDLVAESFFGEEVAGGLGVVAGVEVDGGPVGPEVPGAGAGGVEGGFEQG